MSETTTLNWAWAGFPRVSVAVHVTGVLPMLNELPDAGEHVMDAGSLTPLTSAAVTVQLTTALEPDVVPVGLGSGPKEGGVVSCTVTLASSLLVPSLQLIVESPIGKCAVTEKSCPGPPSGVHVASSPARSIT